MQSAIPEYVISPSARGELQQAAKLLQAAAEAGVFPGAVLRVCRHGELLLEKAVGTRGLDLERETALGPMRTDTVFDIAGLTAVVATATLLMRLLESGRYQLDERAARYLQGFGQQGKSAISIAQLMSHRAGLIHWMPLFEELLQQHLSARLGILTSRAAKEYVYTALNRCMLKYPVGERQVYSDLGLLLLGELGEVLTGATLDKAAQRYVFAPLGLKSTSFVDLSVLRRHGIQPVEDLIAPTEFCVWRKRVLCGEVHDDNAWAMGGIAGHAGLFSSAQDLSRFATALIEAWHGRSAFLRAATVRAFWQPASPEDGADYGLIWELPSKENAMLGCGFSSRAVGCNGFTGCSLWIEPEQELSIVLMTNRIHPSRVNKKLLSFRAELHTQVLRALVKQ